ncbi:MAG: hypothetical protein H6Q68_2022 [Firmicutes bacterium]|nr:hypothetical protein [Bacillota bacterium]
MQLFKNQKGTTLVELLMGMVILVLVLSPIANVIKTSFMAYKYSLSRNLTLTGGYAALNIISDELRYAQSPTTVANKGMEVDYTVVDSADTPQSRRMYIGDGSTANTPVKTLIVEYTDTKTGLKSYKKIANSIISSQTENSNPIPIFELISENETNKMHIRINLQDYSYTQSPSLKLENYVVMSNM